MQGFWVPVCHSRELANGGDYVVLPWKTDGEVVFYNDGQRGHHARLGEAWTGSCSAFNNRCPHRGARVFSGHWRGNQEPVCPYHGTRVSGANTNAFLLGLGVDPWMWVWSEPDVVPVGAYPQRGNPGLSLFETTPDDLVVHSELRFVMNCPWQVAVENALDFDHVPHVHAGSLMALQLQRGTAATGYTDLLWDGSSAERFESGIVQRLDHLQRHFTDAAFLPGFRGDYDYVHEYRFPYTCLSSTRGMTYSLQHYFPRSDGRTEFIHRLYAAKSQRHMGVYFDAVRDMNARVFREDARVCDGMVWNPSSPVDPGEERIAHFREAATAKEWR